MQLSKCTENIELNDQNTQKTPQIQLNTQQIQQSKYAEYFAKSTMFAEHGVNSTIKIGRPNSEFTCQKANSIFIKRSTRHIERDTNWKKIM